MPLPPLSKSKIVADYDRLGTDPSYDHVLKKKLRCHGRKFVVKGLLDQKIDPERLNQLPLLVVSGQEIKTHIRM